MAKHPIGLTLLATATLALTAYSSPGLGLSSQMRRLFQTLVPQEQGLAGSTARNAFREADL